MRTILVQPIKSDSDKRLGFKIELRSGSYELLKTMLFSTGETDLARKQIQKYMVEPVPRIEWSMNNMTREFTQFTPTALWEEIEF